MMDIKHNKKRYLSLTEFKKSLENKHCMKTPNFRPFKDPKLLNFKDNDFNINIMNQTNQIMNTHNNFNDDINNHTLPSFISSDAKKKPSTVKDKTISNFNKSLNKITNLTNTTIIRENLEDERNNLTSFYHMSHNQVTNSNFYSVAKEKKNDIFQKYQINEKVAKDELDKISYYFNPTENNYNWNKKISKSSMRKDSEINDHSKTSCKIFNEYFKSPIKSLKKIKINKQIYNNLMLITISKQAQEYMDKYDQVDHI